MAEEYTAKPCAKYVEIFSTRHPAAGSPESRGLGSCPIGDRRQRPRLVTDIPQSDPDTSKAITAESLIVCRLQRLEAAGLCNGASPFARL